MIWPLLLLLAVVAIAMPPERRTRLLRFALALLHLLKEAATRRYADDERFRAALRARMPLPIVTIALACVNVAVYILMLFGTGSLSDPQTLVGWGASVGPQTTNGEWWRLLTALFVHASVISLIVNVAALLQVGFLLERLAGRLAFAGIYAFGGMFANLVTLSAYPLLPGAGASGAVFALYGLLVAVCGWMVLRPSELRMPSTTLKKLAPIAALFALIAVVNGSVTFTGELTAFVFAMVLGVVLARSLQTSVPPPRLVGATLALAAGVLVACAMPLRGVTDVKPEIARLIELEHRTERLYRRAGGRVDEILRTIVPELQAAEARLKALGNVPPEQQGLVHDAEEYVRLRQESWRLRAESLRNIEAIPQRETAEDPASNARSRVRAETQYRKSLMTLANAEGAERRSLEALHRLQ